ncbi:MAG TPA: hypothetical protein VM425_21210 [Myxococcota bacterium]|nr:hypothetical protein [Myxococcota bacterium]
MPTTNSRKRCLAILLSVAALCALVGCSASERPPNVHIVVLRGSPYERGFQHGRQLSAHIRSLYAKLLASSIMPFLNREQLNIAPVLPVYSRPEYRDGQFSYRMLLESGQYLYDNYLPESYRQELLGIADGAGMEFEQILILNTFVDTMLGFRAIVLFIQGIQDPFVSSFAFEGGVDSDAYDNDGDGQTDEPDEGVLTPYRPLAQAAFVEVPTDARVRVVIKDVNLPGLACLDPRNAFPKGQMEIERRCLLDECVLSSCRGRALLDRDCLSAEAQSCIEPRLSSNCFKEDCLDLTDPGCVNPESIRLSLDGQVYDATSDAVQTRLLPVEGDLPPDVDPQCYGPLEVLFSPPGGFAPASLMSLVIQAGDQSPIYSPEPFHNRYMRDERIVFTTAGYAASTGSDEFPYQIPNRGVWDPSARPPSLAFAVRGSATADGNPLLAHHFALLDSNIVHEHSVLFVHIPDQGRPYAFLSWAGLAWGFSGMNDQGLTYSVNYSDSLDNPLTGGVLASIFEPEHLAELIKNPNLLGLSRALADTHLYATGLPIGIIGREILAHGAGVNDGIESIYRAGRTYGWNFLLADAQGNLAAVETDAASQFPESGSAPAPAQEDGFTSYTPDTGDPQNLDAFGRPWASVGPDDLRVASHFQKDQDDMPDLNLLGLFKPESQRFWSGYYYRSLRAFYVLGDEIASRSGAIDVDETVDILRTPELVDTRDSMNACVYQPADRIINWAMGEVPATDLTFEAFDLEAAIRAGGNQ